MSSEADAAKVAPPGSALTWALMRLSFSLRRLFSSVVRETY